jgi:hypothetical protein
LVGGWRCGAGRVVVDRDVVAPFGVLPWY